MTDQNTSKSNTEQPAKKKHVVVLDDKLYLVYDDWSGLLKDPDHDVFMDDAHVIYYYVVSHLRSLLFHKTYLSWLLCK